MSTHWEWKGLRELQQAFHELPDDLKAEGSHIIEEEGNAAAVAIKAAYPPPRTIKGKKGKSRVVGGTLRDRVFVTHFERSKFSAMAVVKSADPIAYIFDHGTEARHYITKTGKSHATGAMWGRSKPQHVFIRAMITARRQMWRRLKELMVRNGLKVTGDV